MGFFRNRLDKKRRLHELEKRSVELAHHMKTEREMWFTLCIELSNSCIESTSSFNLGQDKISVSYLDGDPSNIIKSFQIVHVLSFINMRQYVSSKCDEFFTMLTSHVFGDDLYKCTYFIKRYMVLEGEDQTESFNKSFLRFSDDLSRSLSTNPYTIPLISHAITTTMPKFHYSTYLLVAKVFGDEAICARLQHILDNINSDKMQPVNGSTTNHSASEPASALEEKAAQVPDVCRMMIGLDEHRFRRDYPGFFEFPDAKYFTIYSTVACALTACIRLHFDVIEEQRTSIEMIVQNNLAELYPEALEDFQDAYRFVSERIMLESDRKMRGQLLFQLAASWVLQRILGHEPGEKDLDLVDNLAALFIEETSRCWK
jgi:hypothetical protein